MLNTLTEELLPLSLESYLPLITATTNIFKDTYFEYLYILVSLLVLGNPFFLHIIV